MQQLSGLDASFLYLETDNAPMHIASLSIYDPSTAPGGKVTFKQILANTMARRHRVPPMSNVLVNVPMRLDHPYWVRDENLDVEYHIRHMALPQPGDWRQLCILTSRLHARPMDRSRPLWEMDVIEGLDNVEGVPKGCFAIYLKIHHAAFDGASAVEMAAALHDLSPDYKNVTDQAEISADSRPSDLSLLIRSQINAVKKPLRMFNVARSTLPNVAKMAAGLRKGELSRVKYVPRTRFNGRVSPHRVFDAMTVDFENIRTIKNVIEGVTVNDVALSICGGAMRKYLLAKNELPDTSTVAMAPINVRTKDQQGQAGNQVSQMTVLLRSDIEGAIERLKAVHRGTRDAKELSNAVGAKAMTDITQFVPSTIAASAAKLSSSLGLANQMKPSFNCTVTNVPGLQVPMYYTGAKMVTSFGLGPVMDSMGVFHAITSYCGQFIISVTACRKMMPDPEFYLQCVRESYDELLTAAKQTQSRKKARTTKK
ncbi:MAG: wax ester/triacylglycerol synthase family O-acyltransferase [Gammaproteobacteria bacterium]|nr:wax ester/triacylglycerol synthase family O-acyltransferase [Gammaproteobacteria bacterium]